MRSPASDTRATCTPDRPRAPRSDGSLSRACSRTACCTAYGEAVAPGPASGSAGRGVVRARTARTREERAPPDGGAAAGASAGADAEGIGRRATPTAGRHERSEGIARRSSRAGKAGRAGRARGERLRGAAGRHTPAVVTS